MSMTVRELIEYLEQFDEDAQVLIMEQPSWPFEYSIDGVITREELIERRKEEDDGTAEELGDGMNKNDVFLVEGTQLRYGDKNAWNM